MAIEKKEIYMIALFIVGIVLLILVIYPFLTSLYNPVLAYIIFLGLWFVLSFFIGSRFRHGLKFGIVSVIIFVLVCIFTPPLILKWDVPPTYAEHRYWGSDLFIYYILSATGLPHQFLYLCTYIFIPILGIIIIALILKGRETEKMLKNIF